MSEHLRITVRFLDRAFHGRGDGGEPEWPPSPLRLYQALVAAAAARWNERENLQHAFQALGWLESQPVPQIIAPAGVSGDKYRLYVPDNVSDLVAKSWSRGNEASIADYRTEKDVRPTWLPEKNTAVHFLWPVTADDPGFAAHREILCSAARSITHLGWGIDMVAAEACVIGDADVALLCGERWRATEDHAGTLLCVPVTGTLEDLKRKHTAFLSRTSGGSFKPVPPLSAFRLAAYRRDDEPPRVPFVAFSILKMDGSGFRPFDPVRNGMRVAGMVRHAAGATSITAALGWSKEKSNRMVLGHGEPEGTAHIPVDGPRFGFVPLPSIEFRGAGRAKTVGSIRRFLVTGLRGCSRQEMLAFGQMLSGQALIEEESRQQIALLSRIPDSEKIVQEYVTPSASWATVTPVILPGYDDPKHYRRRLSAMAESNQSPLASAEQKQLLTKLDDRIELLLRKAIRQAGFSDELAHHADVQWSGSGFWPGSDLASHYAVPEKLRRFSRLHVRITWRNAEGHPLAIPGPLCLGGGRFVGLGLFAPLE